MTTKKTPVELFDIYVSNIADHVAILRSKPGGTRKEPARVRILAIPGDLPEMVNGMMEYRIVAKTQGVVDVWDSTYLVYPNGDEVSLGNRHAAMVSYSKLMATLLRRTMVKELVDVVE
jgi:hypothetical protein